MIDMKPRPQMDDNAMPSSGSAMPYRRLKYTTSSSAINASVQARISTIWPR